MKKRALIYVVARLNSPQFVSFNPIHKKFVVRLPARVTIASQPDRVTCFTYRVSISSANNNHELVSEF